MMVAPTTRWRAYDRCSRSRVAADDGSALITTAPHRFHSTQCTRQRRLGIRSARTAAPLFIPFPQIMQKIEFQLTPDTPYIEVNQLLKAAGVCDSGGTGKHLVAEGMVSVDGVLETRKTAKIRAGQTVTCAVSRNPVRPAVSIVVLQAPAA